MDIELLKSADVKEYFSNLESIKLIDYENIMNSIIETVKRKFDAFKELVKISLEECVLDKENSIYNEYFYEYYLPKLLHCQKELHDYIYDCSCIKNELRSKLYSRLIEKEWISIGLYNNYLEFEKWFDNIYYTSDLFQIRIDIKTIFELNFDRIILKKKISDLINSE